MKAEPLRHYLERIAAREGEVHAFAWFDAERARQSAAEIEATAPPDAPLRHVPVAIKDIIDVAGLPTGMGSPLYADNVAAADADLVARLKRAGALILGKAVTAEFAYFAPGPTRNPHDLARTPGGSSSGSAAAVAAGFAPLAIGTQTAGSVIRPAAFCGVTGFKPSLGRVSTRGVLSWSPRFDTPGVFARSVDECRRVFAAIAEPSPPPRREPEARRPRLAAVRSPVWHLADECQREAFLGAVAARRRGAVEVIEVELPPLFAEAHAAHRCIMAYDGARFFRSLQERHRRELSPQLNELIDRGGRIGDDIYGEALETRLHLQADLASFMRDFDAILTPPATGEAPASLDSTGDPSFCTIWSLCGVPAICIPVARGPHGLPLGLQIVGRAGEDEALLDIAAWVAERL